MFPSENYKTAEEIKKAFPIYCDWCWQYDYGDCDICKGNVHERLAELYSAENERLASQKKELRITIKRDAEVIDLGAKDPADLPEDCGCCVFNNERPVGNYTHTYCVLTGKETNELKLHENCPLEQKEVEV